MLVAVRQACNALRVSKAIFIRSRRCLRWRKSVAISAAMSSSVMRREAGNGARNNRRRNCLFRLRLALPALAHKRRVELAIQKTRLQREACVNAGLRLPLVFCGLRYQRYMAKGNTQQKPGGNDSGLNFEAQLWAAADKTRWQFGVPPKRMLG